HRRHPGKGGHRSKPAVVYFVPGYVWGFPPAAGEPTRDPASAREPSASSGTLLLELEPPGAHAEVYVNGYYMGTAADVAAGLELREGAHRLEIRAPAHQPLVLDVKIQAGRTITYRGVL